jgi:phosphoglucosamine mutase
MVVHHRAGEGGGQVRPEDASAARASHPSIFGTDGIRDRPGRGFLSDDDLARIVSATAFALRKAGEFPSDFPGGEGSTIVIARDTRGSGVHILEALSGRFAAYGHDIIDVGVLPTPGAALVASRWPGIALGVVISASHNPAEYNGIKFVGPTGAKISPEFEECVSEAFWSERVPSPARRRGNVSSRESEALEAYVTQLLGACRRPERLEGHTVALDLANGATFLAAPDVFRRLGMRVETMAHEPDGSNINEGCGALHPAGLAAFTSRIRASCGFCFDGDGDRMIPVSGQGKVLSGDHVLFLAAKHYQRSGLLPRGTVVATVMSNIGLELALRDHEIRLLRTDVGDRNVFLAMVEGGHPVGGEQSGHVIFLDEARTGDGILAAVKLLDVLEGDPLSLDAEAAEMRCYPQVIKNVKVSCKPPLDRLVELTRVVEEARHRLGGDGRVFLRYSGTEPLLRVMVEGPDQGWIDGLAEGVCEAVRKSVPAPE